MDAEACLLRQKERVRCSSINSAVGGLPYASRACIEPHAPAIQATNATTAAASATHTYDGAANSWAKSEVNRSANDEASCDTSCEMAAVSTASCEASCEASREMASVSTASIISSSGPARSLSNGNLGGRGGAGGGGEGDGRAGGGAGDSAGAGAGGTEC